MKALILLCALIPGFAFAESQILNCRPVSCRPYDDNGGTQGQSTCDYEMGSTFVFTLTGQAVGPNNPNLGASVTIKSKDVPDSLTVEMWDLPQTTKGHNIWSLKEDSFKAYLPEIARGGSGTGTVMQFATSAVIEFALVQISCQSN